jgi:hypothetical protein
LNKATLVKARTRRRNGEHVRGPSKEIAHLREGDFPHDPLLHGRPHHQRRLV